MTTPPPHEPRYGPTGHPAPASGPTGPNPGWSGPQPGSTDAEWSQPPPSGPAAASASSGAGRSGRLWLGVVIGVVVTALVGMVLTLTGVLSVGGSDDAANTTPVELPEQLDGLRDTGAVAIAKNAQSGQPVADRNRRTGDLTAQRYQQAFGGAAAGVRQYAPDDLSMFFSVVAVRAPSSGLVNGVQADPADLELAAAPQIIEFVQDSAVECAATVNRSVPAGQEVEDSFRITPVCRRADDALTVYVYGNAEGAEGRARMVALTNAAFDAVRGS